MEIKKAISNIYFTYTLAVSTKKPVQPNLALTIMTYFSRSQRSKSKINC